MCPPISQAVRVALVCALVAVTTAPSTAQRLKDRAGDRGLQIGTVLGSSGPAFPAEVLNPTSSNLSDWSQLLVDNFDVVVLRLYLGRVLPDTITGSYRFGDANRQVAFANRWGLTMRGHPLVWYRDADLEKETGETRYYLRKRSNGSWVYDCADVRFIMLNHIETMMEQYPTVASWDVVNEALDPDSTTPSRAAYRRSNRWAECFESSDILRPGKATIPGYIVESFRKAREVRDRIVQSNPGRKIDLLYTEGFGIQNDPAMLDGVLDLLRVLRSEGGAPDGVGLQFHADSPSDYDSDAWTSFASQVADLGMKTHITELDVKIDAGPYLNTNGGADRQLLEDQAHAFAEIVERFIHIEGRGDLIFWGHTDRWSWLNPRLRRTGPVCFYPTLFYGDSGRTESGDAVRCNTNGDDGGGLPRKPAFDSVYDVLGGETAREGTRSATSVIQAEDHDASHGVRTLSGHVGYFSDDDYMKYASVDFSSSVDEVRLTYAVSAGSAGKTIEVRLDGKNGQVIARHTTQSTGGWGMSTASTFSEDLIGTPPTDVRDVYVVAVGEGGVANLDKLQFVAGGSGGGSGPPYGSVIALRNEATNQLVQVQGDGILRTLGTEVGPEDRFCVRDAGSGKMALWFPRDGLYVQRTSSGRLETLGTQLGPEDTFDWVRHGDGTVSITWEGEFVYPKGSDSNRLYATGSSLGTEDRYTWTTEGSCSAQPRVRTDGEETGVGVPDEFSVAAVVPNPMRSLGTVLVDVPETTEVQVTVYDMLGRQVLAFPPQEVAAGFQQRVALDASALAPGAYVVRVVADGGAVSARTITIVR